MATLERSKRGERGRVEGGFRRAWAALSRAGLRIWLPIEPAQAALGCISPSGIWQHRSPPLWKFDLVFQFIVDPKKQILLRPFKTAVSG